MCRFLTSGWDAHVSARIPPHQPVPMTATPICLMEWLLSPRLHLGAVATDPVRLDSDDQSLLPGSAKRVFVRPEEALGELVDVGVGAGLAHGRLAVEDHVGLGIVAVLHGDDHPGIAT